MKYEIFKPEVRKLWISWTIIFPSIILLKFFKLPFFREIPISIIYFLFCIFLIIIGAIRNQKSRKYIQTHHPRLFDEITYVKFMGSGNYNSIRMREFIKSDKSYDDEMLNRIKVEYSKFTSFTIFVFILFPVCSIIGEII